MSQISYESLPEYEKLATCPFNRAHQVVQHRMHIHIIKCRRSHSTAGTKECNYNVTHIFPINEIAEHEANCPDRVNLELLLMKSKNAEKIEISSYSEKKTSETDDDDMWDLSIDHPSYNPKKHALNSNVLINIQHGTPSQMKAWRKKEKIRLQNIRMKVAQDEDFDFNDSK
ncbi:CLUMA_CG004597, isoform A [Clunio marinus]|uniref:CLUMA_CG004597, isoform A n=1 Tax=Clunio marinus TaxID=568069 RepID=A0A1J1HU63_9DIPT|nr:CLUMA_CG004597, isoform A [Clunio marinus]